jgi:hypothetical protein
MSPHRLHQLLYLRFAHPRVIGAGTQPLGSQYSRHQLRGIVPAQRPQPHGVVPICIWSRQWVPAGEHQPGAITRPFQPLAQPEQLSYGFLTRGIYSLAWLRQHTLHVVQHYDGRPVGEGPLNLLHRCIKVWELGHRPALGQQLPPHAVQHAPGLLVFLHAHEGRPLMTARPHQPPGWLHRHRGLADASLTQHHTVGLLVKQPLQGQQLTAPADEAMARGLQ